MNQVRACRYLSHTAHQRSIVNFGWWWYGAPGRYRRVKGQGLVHQRKYDELNFIDNPEISKNHRFLHRWIKKRIRDQELGLKIFPFFPDILFYVKYYFMLPAFIYISVTTYFKRKAESRKSKRSLMRDRELEDTFYHKSNIEVMADDAWAEFMYYIQYFYVTFLNGDRKTFIDRKEVKTDTYRDLIKGHHELMDDQVLENRFILSSARTLCLADGGSSWSLKMYGKLPLRLLSEFAGLLANVTIPLFAREILYSSYSKAFGVNMSEALEEDLRYYPTFNAFFRRALKPDARPIAEAAMVSPADGRVLHISKCENGFVEQVKGVNYSIRKFLGRSDVVPLDQETDSNFVDKLKIHPQNELYQIVIYLAPGDYHRFHSPSEFIVKKRRYYPGDLFSVNPIIAAYMKDLFVLNERASLIGEWAHGFFAYCAVGATNVGSIIFHYDPDLNTNKPGAVLYGTFEEKDFTEISEKIPDGLPIHKGEMIGEFNLGSTIVLLFEAPPSFNFTVGPGQSVKVGQNIGKL